MLTRLYRDDLGNTALPSIAILIGLGVFTLGPVAAVLIKSFDMAGPGETFRFGLDAWNGLFSDRKNLSSFFYSFLLTIRVPLGLLLALVIAWLLVRVRIPFARFFEYTFWFAFFLPSLPMVTGWLLLLDANYGLANEGLEYLGLTRLFDIHTAGGIIWVHLATHTVPGMVILITPSIRMIDRALDDAAIVAGASALTIFRRIIAPLAIPALFVAGYAGFIKALESFETEQIIGAPAGIAVYSNRIYNFVNESPPQMSQAMALSSVFLVILITLGVIYQLYLRNRGDSPTSFSGQRHGGSSAYSKRVRIGGTVLIAGFITITIFLPFTMLIAGSFMQLFGFLGLEDPWTTRHWVRVTTSDEFVQSLLATLKLGLGAAVPGTLIFAAIAWALMQMRPLASDIGALLAWLPWAFPGIIIGAGLLELMLFTPGFSMLYGTIYPLIYAILIKELPIAVHMLRVSMDQTNRDLSEAAQLTRASWLTRFWRINLPLNAPAVTVVFLLIFSAAATDISSVVLIAPADTQTLSLMMFKYAFVSEFEAATVMGTIISLIALAVSILAFRMAGRVGFFE